MDIRDIAIDAVIPYARNPRLNTDAVSKVAASLKEFGWQQPIVVDKEMVVIAGHTRLLAAKSLGMKEVPIFVADLSEAKAKAYRIADNRVGEEALWDNDALAAEIKELSEMGEERDVLGFSKDELDEIAGDVDSLSPKYTKVIKGPTYEPSGRNPGVEELYDTSKFFKLIASIEEAGLDEDVRKFLIFAAHRHNVFNYSKIADYYAHADETVQQLMEDSALVIIDFDKAIEGGFAILAKELTSIMEEDYGG